VRGVILAASAAFAFTLAVHSAGAQTPSADDIIAGLRPSAAQLKGPTRGIRRMPGNDAPAAEAPAPVVREHHASYRTQAAAEPAAARSDSDGPSVKLVVDFHSGSAELTPAAAHTLDHLGAALSSSALTAYRFRVEGHTDTVGSPEINRELSQKRAETVASYLESKFGIAETRLEAVGKGSSELAVQTPDQTPEPRNRRVKIVNLGS